MTYFNQRFSAVMVLLYMVTFMFTEPVSSQRSCSFDSTCYSYQYCNTAFSVCENRKSLGSYCSFSRECQSGSYCSFNRCESNFSSFTGTGLTTIISVSVSAVVLLVSGIVLLSWFCACCCFRNRRLPQGLQRFDRQKNRPVNPEPVQQVQPMVPQYYAYPVQPVNYYPQYNPANNPYDSNIPNHPPYPQNNPPETFNQQKPNY